MFSKSSTVNMYYAHIKKIIFNLKIQAGMPVPVRLCMVLVPGDAHGCSYSPDSAFAAT